MQKEKKKKKEKKNGQLTKRRQTSDTLLIRTTGSRGLACLIRKWLTRRECHACRHIHNMAQPQTIVQPPPDPVLQEVIDADFKSVNLKLGGPDNGLVLSGANSEEVDEENDLDFTRLNKLSKLLATNPSLRCPPPPGVVSQKLSQVINGTKEEGNVCPFCCVMSSLPND